MNEKKTIYFFEKKNPEGTFEMVNASWISCPDMAMAHYDYLRHYSPSDEFRIIKETVITTREIWHQRLSIRDEDK